MCTMLLHAVQACTLLISYIPCILSCCIPSKQARSSAVSNIDLRMAAMMSSQVLSRVPALVQSRSLPARSNAFKPVAVSQRTSVKAQASSTDSAQVSQT